MRSRPAGFAAIVGGLILLSAVADAHAGPYIVLGPSDGIALDQPRVAVELFNNPDGDPSHSVGPSIYNTWLLDTAASSILAMQTAVNDMKNPPNVYQTQGTFVEQGVAGDHDLDTSVAYRFDFAGTLGLRRTINGTRILSDDTQDFSMFGPWGLVGMPAMVDRVTSLDFTGWSGVQEIYMDVAFTDGPEDPPPSNGHRYSIPVDNRIQFDPADQDHTGDLPVWADIPFLTATPVHNGVAVPGDFAFDTGAQMSLLSVDTLFNLGMDADGDGDLLDDKIPGGDVEIVGLGGSIVAPTFLVDEMRVSTVEGVDLIWTNFLVIGLMHADPNEPPLEQLPFDGAFGAELLTSGWFDDVFLGATDDGYIDSVHLDFRQMDIDGTGIIYFDLNAGYDHVVPATIPPLLETCSEYVVPEPETLALATIAGLLLLLHCCRRRKK